jgi:hypothetical protein
VEAIGGFGVMLTGWAAVTASGGLLAAVDGFGVTEVIGLVPSGLGATEEMGFFGEGLGATEEMGFFGEGLGATEEMGFAGDGLGAMDEMALVGPGWAAMVEIGFVVAGLEVIGRAAGGLEGFPCTGIRGGVDETCPGEPGRGGRIDGEEPRAGRGTQALHCGQAIPALPLAASSATVETLPHPLQLMFMTIGPLGQRVPHRVSGGLRPAAHPRLSLYNAIRMRASRHLAATMWQFASKPQSCRTATRPSPRHGTLAVRVLVMT